MNLGSPQEPPAPTGISVPGSRPLFHGILYERDLGSTVGQAGEEGVPEVPEEMDHRFPPELSTLFPSKDIFLTFTFMYLFGCTVSLAARGNFSCCVAHS